MSPTRRMMLDRLMMRALLLVGLLAIAVSISESAPPAAAVPADEASTELVLLFDGTSIDGWKQYGGQAKYRVKEGAIVGTTVFGEENSFLSPPREYANFILEYEFKVDPRMNSGVQIRSHVFPEDHIYDYKNAKGEPATRKVAANRFHGYQVEIDPSDRAWTGGIYDEGRRGWLFDLSKNQAAGAAFKQNEWNHIRVECRGNSIKTFVNGVPAADLVDDMDAEGKIAFQVHKTNVDEPREVRWRNIRIQELP